MDREAMRAKALALRRYEGLAEPVREALGLEVFAPFGPQIARDRVAPALVARLNAHGDRFTRGQPGGEFGLEPEIVLEGGEDSLLRVTERLIGRYVEALHGVPPRRIEIQMMWIVSQPAGSPSPVHFHSGEISGVLYLKVPRIADPEREEEKTYISGRQAGFINFMTGGRQEFSRTLVSFRPVVGDFYVFPGWLLHGAEPFRGEGERRSLAFNAAVEVE